MTSNVPGWRSTAELHRHVEPGTRFELVSLVYETSASPFMLTRRINLLGERWESNPRLLDSQSSTLKLSLTTELQSPFLPVPVSS